MQCATKLISSPHPGERRRLDPMPISSVSPNISPLHPSDASLLFYRAWNICFCSQNYDRQVKDTDNFLYLWRWEQHYKWGLGGFWFNGVFGIFSFCCVLHFPLSSPMCSNIFFFFFLRLILLCSSPPANWRENNRGVAAVGSYTDLIVCSLNETRTTLMMMMMVAVFILVMVMMTMVLMVILVMMMFATTKP